MMIIKQVSYKIIKGEKEKIGNLGNKRVDNNNTVETVIT